MSDDHKSNEHVAIVRERRKNKTKSEGLLWSILRAKQLCGLKFRREHPVGPYFTDFACVSEQIVVEVDGGYHAETAEADLRRQAYLEREGWKVFRFTDKEVEEDAEAVARGIAKQMGLEYRFKQRNARSSGMKSVDAKKPKLK